MVVNSTTLQISDGLSLNIVQGTMICMATIINNDVHDKLLIAFKCCRPIEKKL